MTDKKKAIRPCEFFSICMADCGGTLEDIEICSCYEIFKQLKRKEQECEELETMVAELETMVAEAKEAPICFCCSEEPCIRQERDKYKQALDKIEKLISKFDTSTECDYGDFDCENCSSLDEEIVCGYKLKKIIKGIINKVKEK